MASLASLGKSFNLFGMWRRRPLTRPLVDVHAGTGQLLLLFFLCALIKQGLQTLASELKSESERPKRTAEALVTAREFSTVNLQTLH